jgi:hypothetical protein
MEAATALTTAGFRILDITGMNAYQVRNKKLGTYQPDSVRLELMIVKEPPAS